MSPINKKNHYLRSLVSKSRRKRPNWLWYLFLLLLAQAVLIGAISGGVIYYFYRQLPPVDNLDKFQPNLVTNVFGDDDKLIGSFYVERRIYTKLDQIPKHLHQAIIAVEDSRFYEHRGVDYIGILRALIVNIEALKIKQGASTITQQLARGLFLSPVRSFKRKIIEALLAMKIERILSKDKILEMYINQIYFGHGAYGVQAAAYTYFGKDVSKLSLPEAALIAGLPKGPTNYSPYNHPTRAKQRQGLVLKRMVQEEYITTDEAHKASLKDLFFNKLEKKKQVGAYFLEMVRQYLIKRYGDDMVYKGGLRVQTTLNLDMQQTADQAIVDGILTLDKRQGFRVPKKQLPEADIKRLKEQQTRSMNYSALQAGDILEGIVTDIKEQYATVWLKDIGLIEGRLNLKDAKWAKKRLTGPDVDKDRKTLKQFKMNDLLLKGDIIKVRIIQLGGNGKIIKLSLEQVPAVEGSLIAIDHSTGYIKALVGGYDFAKSEFNRAVSARRQPGSAFKPIIFATALENGYTPASIIIDAPVIFTDPVTKKTWKPANYEKRFFGPTTLREALIHSRNLATINLLEDLGVGKVIKFSKKIGIKTKLHANLSIALGSSGISLLELTSAYGVFANQGIKAEPLFILSVTDSSGKILESAQPKRERVLPEDISYLINNMLEDVVQRGTGRKAKVLGIPIAGKTGTTNNFTDALFIGYSSNISLGVWVGFDDMRSLGNKEVGAKAALPIWIDFMKNTIDLMPPSRFHIPQEIKHVRIDPKSGLRTRDKKNYVIEVFAQNNQPTEYIEDQVTGKNFFMMDYLY